ncbi:MAG: hypothetical protein AAF682_05875 [Planctomycetota bacterium]
MAAAVRYSEHRRRPYGTIAVLLLLAIGLAWVLIPLARGQEVPNPVTLVGDLLSRDAIAAEEDEGSRAPAEGKVRVFVSGRTIPAYSKIVRDDLWNASMGDWAISDLDESMVEDSGILVDVQDIVGRVVGHDKAPGYVFTEKDFLPPGTRPGLSAGVPAGKRALRIEVDKVTGIVGLQPGDRFDVVGAFPVQVANNSSAQGFGGVYADLVGSKPAKAPKRARVKVLVQNGVVVSPLHSRQVPIKNTSLTQGTSVRTIPVQEMVIAISPEEAAPLMEALSVEAEITCLARSGHPDDPVDSATPSSDPEPPTWNSFLMGGSMLPGATLSNGSSEGGAAGPMSIVESINDEGRALVPVPGVAAKKDSP